MDGRVVSADTGAIDGGSLAPLLPLYVMRSSRQKAEVKQWQEISSDLASISLHDESCLPAWKWRIKVELSLVKIVGEFQVKSKVSFVFSNLSTALQLWLELLST
jgi:hypothetical protein